VKKANPFIVGATSSTVLSLELAWTRLFSAEFFYTFAFLILSLAVLGLGLGALALRLFPILRRERSLGIVLALAGVAALAGPLVLFALQPDLTHLFRDPAEVGKFALALSVLTSAHLFSGIGLAWIFRAAPRRIPVLYMADLVAAGVSVVIVIGLMNGVGTPVAAFYCALPVLVASFLVSRRAWKLLPTAVAIAMVLLAATRAERLELQREERAPVVYKHWDAMAKIKIFDFNADYRGLNIDNAANSPVYRFDGNWDRPDSLRFDFGIDVSYLLEQLDSCTFLSLGAGGGVDVLQALQCGATEIHAVEVVPHVNELMTSGELAEFSGHIYADPRVRVATEDARAYVRRHPDTFDFIYSLSSNTFSALASGSFAMAESYLFTTEAFQDYWQALTPDGSMMMEHQFYMPRLVSQVIEGLEALGVEDARAHFAVYDLPTMRRKMLLLSKRPLTPEIRRFAFGELTPEIEEHIYLLYPAAEGHEDNRIARIVAEGWQAVQGEAEIDLSPCNDNRPFAAQLGLWKNFSLASLEQVSPYEFRGFPLAKLLIGVILLLAVCLVIPLNLLPYVTKGENLRPVPWIYFFVLGMAFMCVEITLIHKYALLIGPSLHSVTTVLVSLLLASGIGSRVATRVPDRLVFGAIIAWILLDGLLFPRLVAALGHWTLAPRIAVAAALIAPVGFFMGMPFPKAGLRVGSAIDWGFAVNGAASVIGATGVLLICFTQGFRAALAVAAALYLVAFILLSLRRGWESRASAPVHAEASPAPETHPAALSASRT
jgi:predicted membrane-bound spermidine synthase